MRDSYGNPAEYDTLEAIDAKKPSKTHSDPNKFLIPGYASGIFQPHEVPTRSNFNSEQPRKIDDDRIHFVDPLQNAFQSSDKSFQAPSPSLSTPLGIDSSQPAPTPINIPRPNIDLQETPQAPIDDPLNHPLTPPKDNSQGAPSFALEVPRGTVPQLPVSHELVPPQIPTDGQAGINIPRPNLDIGETPIDNSNGPLNQGLLPPPSQGSSPIFSDPTQNGPVIIPEGGVSFAPKPSNGLLPPKDAPANDIVSFQGPPSTAVAPTSGVLPAVVENKFTGSFGGAPGVLGGRPSQPTSNQIPVQVIQGPFPSLKPPPAPTVIAQAPKDNTQKYQGTFGGSPGVLVSDNQFDRVSLPEAQPTAPVPSVVPAAAAPTQLVNKFTGSFGGSQGVLGGGKVAAPTTQTFTQLPTVSSDHTSKASTAEKYTGQFGGSPGVLQAFDNLKN